MKNLKIRDYSQIPSRANLKHKKLFCEIWNRSIT